VATHDYVIDNGTGAAVRSDINGALAAIVSQNSNASAPATTYAYMSWADTSAGVMKMRNGANSAWISLYELDGTFLASDISLAAGSAAAPSLFFTGDTNTGLFSPGADTVALATAGSNRLHISSGGLVGIGTTGPDKKMHIAGSSGDGVLVSTGGYQTTGSNAALYLSGGVNNNGDFAGFAIASEQTSPASHVLKFCRATANANNTNYAISTEYARIDSSGRLLVGTSTNASNAIAVVQGIAGDSTTTGALAIRYGSTRPTGTDVGIGAIRFESTSNTSSNYHYAQISCATDGASSSDTDIPGRLVFSTTADGASSPTERMRIRNDGSSSTFSSAAGFFSKVSTGAGTSIAVFAGQHTATSTQNGTDSFIVWSNGNVVNTNNSYGAISDLKLKENIVDANSQWDDLKALQVRNYNFKEGQTHTQIGLVAQEAELVSPGLVSESPDRDAEGNDLGTVTKSVNYSVLYMKAVKALQEAMERIEALEASNADMLARVTALEAA